MQQLFVFYNLLLVLAFSSVLSSVILLMTICCNKKKKKKRSTISLKSEIQQQEESAMTQAASGKELSAQTAVPASTRDKPVGSKSVYSTNIPVEKTTQKAPTATDIPQGGVKPKPATTTTNAPSLQPATTKATKTPKKDKGQKKGEAVKKKVSTPGTAPTTKKEPEVISLIPMSPSTPTSVPTISSKGTSGTSRLSIDTTATVTGDSVPSSAIFEVEDDSSSISTGKKRKSAAIRAHEDGPEDETTDPGSYHTLADMHVDKVFKRVG